MQRARLRQYSVAGRATARMSDNILLMDNLFYVAILSLVVVLAPSCRYSSSNEGEQHASPNTQPAQNATEQALIEVVRNWYRAKGLEAPSRIIVAERSDDVWLIRAGPEIKEAGFWVDPKTRKIVRHAPGY